MREQDHRQGLDQEEIPLTTLENDFQKKHQAKAFILGNCRPGRAGEGGREGGGEGPSLGFGVTKLCP